MMTVHYCDRKRCTVTALISVFLTVALFLSVVTGCGIVEFSSPLDAQRAINQLNDTPLMGRLIFVREDREEGDSRGFDSNSNRGPSFRQVQQTVSQGQGQGQVGQCNHEYPDLTLITMISVQHFYFILFYFQFVIPSCRQ
jgi:RNA recognition motif-containing protein